LNENKKIHKATHRIIAYRILLDDNQSQNNNKQTLIEEYDDDGEDGGGQIILSLLQNLNIVNIVVMIVRWYGGVFLYNDRFKHIATCTRDILEQENITAKEKPQATSK